MCSDGSWIFYTFIISAVASRHFLLFISLVFVSREVPFRGETNKRTKREKERKKWWWRNDIFSPLPCSLRCFILLGNQWWRLGNDIRFSANDFYLNLCFFGNATLLCAGASETGISFARSRTLINWKKSHRFISRFCRIPSFHLVAVDMCVSAASSVAELKQVVLQISPDVALCLRKKKAHILTTRKFI